jgi:NAD(P)-dependent dehydrogenase (short-subunit alcohol dehydrogenase family)
VLAGRTVATLDPLVRECRERGGAAIAVPTDVCDERAVRALADAAVGEFGRIDVWVGNAGVFAYGAFEELDADVFRKVVETNLLGQVHGARAALPPLRRTGGTLVIVASLYSQVGSPAISPYVTSKFGLLGFAESLRQELRGTGVRVRVVLPGSVDTPIYQHAANVTGRHVRPLPPVVSPERVARAVVRSPRRRRFAAFVGRTQRLVVPIHDIAPPLYDVIAGTLMDRVELHGRRPSPTAGTVFAPAETTGPVTGGWRSVRGRVSVAVLALAAVVWLRRGPRT